MKISISNLSKKFNEKVLFDNLSLEIDENKITCIYGSSGCGKTTLIDIIGFIEPYNSGTILYDGIEINKSKVQRKMLRENIGFIFQDFALLENETVLNNMLFSNKIRKIKNAKEAIENILVKFQLEEMLHRKVYELSGGEQQRIAIAKTMLKNPDIILADEPTASLDYENKKIVLQMLRQFVDLGKTVVIVSHDKEIVEFSDVKIDLSREIYI